MVTALLIGMMIPPPPPPPVQQPDRFPGYEATCHTVDFEGRFHTAALRVSGQATERVARLSFDGAEALPANWPRVFEGLPQTFATHFVTDGTYRYLDYLTVNPGRDAYLVVIEALGPEPDIFTLDIKNRITSPVFEAPGVRGICRPISSPRIPQ